MIDMVPIASAIEADVFKTFSNEFEHFVVLKYTADAVAFVNTLSQDTIDSTRRRELTLACFNYLMSLYSSQAGSSTSFISIVLWWTARKVLWWLAQKIIDGLLDAAVQK